MSGAQCPHHGGDEKSGVASGACPLCGQTQVKQEETTGFVLTAEKLKGLVKPGLPQDVLEGSNGEQLRWLACSMLCCASVWQIFPAVHYLIRWTVSGYPDLLTYLGMHLLGIGILHLLYLGIRAKRCLNPLPYCVSGLGCTILFMVVFLHFSDFSNHSIYSMQGICICMAIRSVVAAYQAIRWEKYMEIVRSGADGPSLPDDIRVYLKWDPVGGVTDSDAVSEDVDILDVR